jgi:sterol desaturase/sphingolipid hydroxylase (fatty acid hydroxylase superfamily)
VNLDLSALQTLSHGLGWTEYYLWHVAGFLAAYFLFATAFRRIIRDVLIERGYGAYIDPRPLKPGQIGREIRQSMISILFLSFTAVLALKLEQYGHLRILWKDIGIARALFDLGLFAVWNEIWFFACHWLLHRPWFFKRVHIAHHHSVTVTPFTSLSFHWFEALLLSGTMISIQLLHGFNILSIMLWPGISLLCNIFGHSNFTFHASRRGERFLENNWRHNLHHTKVGRNFGFWTPWPDALLAAVTGRKGGPKPKADP